MEGNSCDYGRRYNRQVAKVSISHVPPTSTAGTDYTGGGGGSSLVAPPKITFKLSVQERYKVLRGTSTMMRWEDWNARDEKDDYDGDDIEQRLVPIHESLGDIMEGVYRVPTELFSTSTQLQVSELKYLFRAMVLNVMSSAVPNDRLDIEKTYESVCKEVVDWINNNRDRLQRYLIGQVHVHVDVLSREIEEVNELFASRSPPPRSMDVVVSDHNEVAADDQDPSYKQRRQVAKVSIFVPPTSTDPGDGFVLSSSTSSRVLFKFTVQEKYRLLREEPLLYGMFGPCPDQDEKDDYDGDEIDQTLVIVDEKYHGDTKVYEASTLLFSPSFPASVRDKEIRNIILEVMLLAVEDNRLKMEITYESVCKEMVDWVNNNLGSLESNLIEQVQIKVDVLTRDITDEVSEEDEDNEVDHHDVDHVLIISDEEMVGYDDWDHQDMEEDDNDEELQRLQAEEEDAVRAEAEWFRNCLIESALTTITQNDHDTEQQQQEVDENNCCSICMNDEENDVVQLQCSHIFHKHCIVRWLQQQTSCPMCRFQVIRAGDEATD